MEIASSMSLLAMTIGYEHLCFCHYERSEAISWLVAEKVVFRRLLKNAQMQGSRKQV
jgi:hypothetical protein